MTRVTLPCICERRPSAMNLRSCGPCPIRSWPVDGAGRGWGPRSTAGAGFGMGLIYLTLLEAFFPHVETADSRRCDTKFCAVIPQARAPRLGFATVEIDDNLPA